MKKRSLKKDATTGGLSIKPAPASFAKPNKKRPGLRFERIRFELFWLGHKIKTRRGRIRPARIL